MQSSRIQFSKISILCFASFSTIKVEIGKVECTSRSIEKLKKKTLNLFRMQTLEMHLLNRLSWRIIKRQEYARLILSFPELNLEF